MRSNDSLTDEQYWNEIWDGQQHKVRRLRRVYVANRRLARLFQQALASFQRPTILEVGCADSLWLPFLAQRYSAEASGVDYSEIGCRLARRNLAMRGAEAKIICRNFFDFAAESPEAFDFVYSLGVVEHFTDPTPILTAMYRVLRPGGKMLTTFPNLCAFYTHIARRVSPELLATHQNIRPGELSVYLQAVGFKKIEAGYTGGAFKLSLVDFSPCISTIGKRGHDILCKLINLTDVVVANMLTALRVPNQRFTSPYVYALCEK
jgi:2-polyprenyl-6-hydroxyphenyl methylase/3-demethylubiquinone-9 3-methyltransferase